MVVCGTCTWGSGDISFMGVILLKVGLMNGEIETLALLMSWSPSFSPQRRWTPIVLLWASPPLLGGPTPKSSIPNPLRTAVRKIMRSSNRHDPGDRCVRTLRVCAHSGKPRFRKEAGLLIVRQYDQSTVACIHNPARPGTPCPCGGVIRVSAQV